MPKYKPAVPVPDEQRPAGDTQQIMVAARDDLSQFGEVYARYSDRIYGYCLRRLDSVPDAEDLTSQVFERAMAGLDGYRGGSVAAWLFRIARNAVIDYVRRRKPAVPLDAAPPHLVSDDPSPIDQLLHAERWQTVRSLIDDLPDDQADLLVMRIVGGLSAEEIGEVFGKSAGAVRVELHRIVKKLRVRYAQCESETTE
jgi:RNA polymerase sigma-70 factor, ECF subfamily